MSRSDGWRWNCPASSPRPGAGWNTVKQPANEPPHAAASARATAELRRALVHYQAGRRDAALACCRTATELCPDYAEAHDMCAVMLITMGRRDESLAEFDEAIRLNPEYVEAHCNRGNALWAGDRLDGAEAAFRKASNCSQTM